MKILNEADIFDSVQGYDKRELDLMPKEERFDSIVKLLKDKYGEDKYNKVINTSDVSTNILNSIVNSIDNYGTDDVRNKSLFLLDKIIDKNRGPLKVDGFNLIANLLQKNSIDFNKEQGWILDPKSYEPLYKAKALSFLSTDQAENFGDDVDEAKLTILGLNDEQQIKNYLSNWQTKEGTSSNLIDGEDMLLRILKVSSYENLDAPIKELSKYIQSLEEYKNLKDSSKAVLNISIEDNPKELQKILDKSYKSSEDFKKEILKFIKDNSI